MAKKIFKMLVIAVEDKGATNFATRVVGHLNEEQVAEFVGILEQIKLQLLIPLVKAKGDDYWVEEEVVN